MAVWFSNLHSRGVKFGRRGTRSRQVGRVLFALVLSILVAPRVLLHTVSEVERSHLRTRHFPFLFINLD
jgi:hypothetical protein